MFARVRAIEYAVRDRSQLKREFAPNVLGRIPPYCAPRSLLYVRLRYCCSATPGQPGTQELSWPSRVESVPAKAGNTSREIKRSVVAALTGQFAGGAGDTGRRFASVKAYGLSA